MYAPQPASSAYARVGLETGVVAASPHKLITLLYEAAVKAIRDALAADADLAARARAIARASNLVSEGLRGALDPVRGGEIAAGLDALYDYIGSRLLEANLTRQREPLVEALELLGGLASTWQEISVGPGDTTPRTAPLNVAA